MNRLLLRPRVLGVIALLVFVSIALFQLPCSPAASYHFMQITGTPVFDERPSGYTLSGVLYALDRLDAGGLFDYEAYRVVDAVFPWFLCALVAAVMLRIEAARATLWPWLAAVADTAENIAQFRILVTRDDLSPQLVQWASLLTQIKFAMVAIMLAMLLAVGARYVWRMNALSGAR